MKLNGGYDFPGSNSGVDLYALTGWLPEATHTDSPGFNADGTWRRLLSGAGFADCLITVATGALSDAEAERAGLVQLHAYAVPEHLDQTEIDTMLVFSFQSLYLNYQLFE